MARQRKTTDTRITAADTSTTDTTAADPPVKKRGRPVGSKNKNGRPDRQPDVDQGDNSKYLSHDMKLFKLPVIDVNNPSAVQQRILEYFDICTEDDIKPSVASLALAFGISRVTLFNWLNGRNDRIKNIESVNALKRAYDYINSYYEHLMNNNKINPVAGIFLMKNNLGYRDTTDYIVTANTDNNMSLPDITNRAGLLEE